MIILQINRRKNIIHAHAVSLATSFSLTTTHLHYLSSVKIFDMLHLNGQSLLHKSLKFRKRNLRACVTEIQGRIEYATEWEGKTAQDVRDRMEDIMNDRGEGLVLKHPDSEYVLNGRNKDWIKVKPEYMVRIPLRELVGLIDRSRQDNMGETVDVLVVSS